MKPLALGQPEIEVETQTGRVFDLYNMCDFVGVHYDGERLRFDFRGFDGVLVSLEFREPRGLTVDQPIDWGPGERHQIDHLLVRPDGQWRQVDFLAGGLTYRFDAQELVLITDDWTPRFKDAPPHWACFAALTDSVGTFSDHFLTRSERQWLRAWLGAGAPDDSGSQQRCLLLGLAADWQSAQPDGLLSPSGVLWIGWESLSGSPTATIESTTGAIWAGALDSLENAR